MIQPSKIFLVHNGGCYSDYGVLALFTEKDLADRFAVVSNGVVEEWPANVPPDKWVSWKASLKATKEKGKWKIRVHTFRTGDQMKACSIEDNLPHGALGWNTASGKNGVYTEGYANAQADTEEKAKKVAIDLFWKQVAEFELENVTTA